jgi:DNA-binding transcriptional MocR family regulator
VDNVRSVLPELRDLALARFAEDAVPAHDVAVCNGALDAMERVLVTHVTPGDSVLVEDPGYPPVLYLVAALGLKAVAAPVDRDGLRPDGLEKGLRAKVRAVIVTPRAQNPTGAFISPERAEMLRGMLRGHPEVLVIEDDHASNIAGPAATTLAEAGRARWAVIRSASKSLGADLRLAILAADPSTLAMVRGKQRRGPGWVSGLIQQIVLHQWTNPGALDVLRAAKAAYAQRRATLIEALAGRGIEATGLSGLNVWVPVSDEDFTAARLLDAGYRLSVGRKFRRAAPPGVRITISAFPPGEADALADALADAVADTPDTPRRTGGSTG